MTLKKPTYKDLDEHLRKYHQQKKMAVAGSAARLREMGKLVQERTAELTSVISTLHEEVMERIEAEQSLRSMAARLVMSERKDRQQLAQLLHDNLQQFLVAALFHTSSLKGSSDAQVQKTASDLESVLKSCINVTRSLTSELSPPILHGRSLIPAFNWLARWMQEKYGLNVKVSFTSDIFFDKEEHRILLFESVRELLFNIVKHAGTDTAYLEFNKTGDQIEIQVRDDGCGFEASEVLTEGFGFNSLGLFSIRERLILLGGSIQVESSPGNGSKFTLVVPAA